ncbi:MAG TPA: hypothetical protein VEO54_17725 [Thermoanaerobaculia bacterium]|nr:hypothetical protein [Thermoanaerobaculia bacterium]
MRERLRVVFVCLLLAACGAEEPAAVEQSAAVARPKPPAASGKVTWKISGTHLESEALNFRIDAPAGYTWRNESDDDGQYLFVAKSDSATVRLLIQGRNYDPVTEARTYEYVNGMRGAYELREMRVQDVLVSRRRSKLGPGYSYFFRAVKGDRAARVTGYLVASDRLYSLEHVSAMPHDVLGPFVSSLAPAR